MISANKALIGGGGIDRAICEATRPGLSDEYKRFLVIMQSIDQAIFCTYENADYDIYKDLMSTVYFPASKYHLTNIFMKENSNTDCVVNMKSAEKSENLSALQVYPNFSQNKKSESLAERFKIISRNVDFNVDERSKYSIRSHKV